MNWDMIGHEWAIHLLSRHITNKSPRHAYLLTGSQGSGRRTLAIRFSQALNCLNPPLPGMPCLACQTCRQIEQCQHPDLVILKAEQHGGQIRIEQIRELQHFIALSPYAAKYRIAILLHFEDANPHAANALLKTLEEPPDRVVLILTAESSESLLSTIVSRCEPIALRPISKQMIQEDLQSRFKIPENEARLLSHISGGQPGLAIRYKQSPDEFIKRKKDIEDLFFLLSTNLVERFNYIEVLVKDKSSTISSLETWQSIWRDILLQKINPGFGVTNLDYDGKIAQISTAVELFTASHALHMIRHTLSLIEQNINLRLGMEVLVMDLPKC